MKGFKNTNIYVEGKGVIKTSLLIKDGKIAQIGDVDEVGLIELPDDQIVVPGFIDEHIHGCFGHDVMDASIDGLIEMSKQLEQEGVTYFCPTTMSMSVADIKKSLANIKEVKKIKKEGAEIIGIHLEGPFLSKVYCGAQDKAHIIKGDYDTLNDFIKTSNEDIRIVTFAPEEGGDNILPLMTEKGITPSMGHSDASAKQAFEAIEHGAKCATHCYNAMKGIHHRDVGLLGAVLLSDELMCELIADFKHVGEDAVRLLFKVKGPEKIILVSDSMEAKYLPDGEYELGGQKVYVKDGAARLASGTLAGSVLRLDDALRNIHSLLPELSFTQVIDLVTKNPAKNLNIDDIGTIKVGNRARFAVITKDFNVLKTI